MSDDAGANDVQVAVIGFGPSGAVAASLLGRSGVRGLVVDRQRTVYDKPRAIAIDHEILRLLDNLGVADRVLPYIEPFPASEHFGAQGQLIRRIDMVSPPYPLGYTPSMVFTQPPVEAALREHAMGYDGIEISLGTELISLEQSDTGVILHLRDDQGGNRVVSADYVIACDGAASTVRQLLELPLDDLVFDEPWLVVDVRVHEHALARLPQAAAQYCDPARPTTFIIGPGNHRRWEIMLLPGEDPRAMEQPDRVWQLLAKWPRPDDATLWRSASYRFHALVATQWRERRVVLAGDAAHQQPPFIGQGMCQGVRDVANLVWKLERVIKGQSSDALLDTYGEERGTHVRELTSRIKAIGHVICERDPEVAQARDARILAEGGGSPRTITRQEIVPPLQTGLLASPPDPARGTLFPQPWVAVGSGRKLLDAACGEGWRLVLDGRDAPAPDPGQADALGLRTLTILGPGTTEQPHAEGCAVTELEGVMADWFDRHGCHAAVVRPDHYVFGVAADTRSLSTLLSGLQARLH